MSIILPIAAYIGPTGSVDLASHRAASLEATEGVGLKVASDALTAHLGDSEWLRDERERGNRVDARVRAGTEERPARA